MSARLVRALVALGVIGASLFFALTTPAKLGPRWHPDSPQTRDSPRSRPTQSTDRALEVLRRRVDALGVAEPSATPSAESSTSPECRSEYQSEWRSDRAGGSSGVASSTTRTVSPSASAGHSDRGRG